VDTGQDTEIMMVKIFQVAQRRIGVFISGPTLQGLPGLYRFDCGRKGDWPGWWQESRIAPFLLV
jgi:hypothetical protein